MNIDLERPSDELDGQFAIDALADAFSVTLGNRKSPVTARYTVDRIEGKCYPSRAVVYVTFQNVSQGVVLRIERARAEQFWRALGRALGK